MIELRIVSDLCLGRLHYIASGFDLSDEFSNVEVKALGCES
jgi:hypothetical protein